MVRPCFRPPQPFFPSRFSLRSRFISFLRYLNLLVSPFRSQAKQQTQNWNESVQRFRNECQLIECSRISMFQEFQELSGRICRMLWAPSFEHFQNVWFPKCLYFQILFFQKLVPDCSSILLWSILVSPNPDSFPGFPGFSIGVHVVFLKRMTISVVQIH